MIIYVKYIFIIAWMLLIFSLSNEPATASTARSDIILHAVQSIHLSYFEHATEFIVRKSAHFSAYLILGALIFNLVKDYVPHIRKSTLISILFAGMYACTDEFHQLFVVGRTGQPRDVLIDTIGAIVGVAIYVSIVHINYRKVKDSIQILS